MRSRAERAEAAGDGFGCRCAGVQLVRPIRPGVVPLVWSRCPGLGGFIGGASRYLGDEGSMVPTRAALEVGRSTPEGAVLRFRRSESRCDRSGLTARCHRRSRLEVGSPEGFLASAFDSLRQVGSRLPNRDLRRTLPGNRAPVEGRGSAFVGHAHWSGPCGPFGLLGAASSGDATALLRAREHGHGSDLLGAGGGIHHCCHTPCLSWRTPGTVASAAGRRRTDLRASPAPDTAVRGPTVPRRNGPRQRRSEEW
jgi:hypothetical protein